MYTWQAESHITQISYKNIMRQKVYYEKKTIQSTGYYSIGNHFWIKCKLKLLQYEVLNITQKGH